MEASPIVSAWRQADSGEAVRACLCPAPDRRPVSGRLSSFKMETSALGIRIRIVPAAAEFPALYDSPLLIARLCHDSDLELLSCAWGRALGWKTDALSGHQLDEFLDGSGREAAGRMFRCAPEDGRPEPIAFSLIGRDAGRMVRRPFLWHYLRDDYEDRIFVVGIGLS